MIEGGKSRPRDLSLRLSETEFNTQAGFDSAPSRRRLGGQSLVSGRLLRREGRVGPDAADELQSRVHQLRISLWTDESAFRPVEIQHSRPHDPGRSGEAEEDNHPPLLGEAAFEKTECEIEH